MEVLEVLKGARDLIADGWTQAFMGRTKAGGGTYNVLNRDDITCFCMRGALARVVGGYMEAEPARLVLYEFVPPLPETEKVCPVVFFNDAPGRTQEEVVAVFNTAIAKLERDQTKKNTLLKAAELLETKGWVQGDLACDKEGEVIMSIIDAETAEEATCFCAEGAVEAAMCLTVGFNTALERDLLNDLCCRLSLPVAQGLWCWNDEPGRTKEEVIKLLRDTAESY